MLCNEKSYRYTNRRIDTILQTKAGHIKYSLDTFAHTVM